MRGRTRRSARALPAQLALVLVLVALLASGCSRPGSSDEPAPLPPSTPAATGAAAPRPGYHDTGDGSELVPTLTVRPRATLTSRRVVYSQEVTVHEGQVLLAVAEFQVTNDLDVNVYVGSTVLLATTPAAVTGKEITAANGQNVTPAVHHGQQSKNGTYQVTGGDVGVRYVNVVAWAAASNARAGDRVVVNQGYGRLSVLTW